jgi:hypothetical protein
MSINKQFKMRRNGGEVGRASETSGLAYSNNQVRTMNNMGMADSGMNMGTPMNYGSPLNTGDKRLSGSERRNKAEGINVKSPKIQEQYQKYKESGGKLSINAAARIGFASPEESRRRMKQANIPGSRGRDALKGV